MPSAKLYKAASPGSRARSSAEPHVHKILMGSHLLRLQRTIEDGHTEQRAGPGALAGCRIAEYQLSSHRARFEDEVWHAAQQPAINVKARGDRIAGNYDDMTLTPS